MSTLKAHYNAYSSGYSLVKQRQFSFLTSHQVSLLTTACGYTCSLSPSCSLNLILCSTLSFFSWRSYLLSTSMLIWIQEIGLICWLLWVVKTRSWSNKVWLCWTSMNSWSKICGMCVLLALDYKPWDSLSIRKKCVYEQDIAYIVICSRLLGSFVWFLFGILGTILQLHLYPEHYFQGFYGHMLISFMMFWQFATCQVLIWMFTQNRYVLHILLLGFYSWWPWILRFMVNSWSLGEQIIQVVGGFSRKMISPTFDNAGLLCSLDSTWLKFHTFRLKVML